MDETTFLNGLSEEQKAQYAAMKTNLKDKTGKDLTPPTGKPSGVKTLRIVKVSNGIDAKARQALTKDKQTEDTNAELANSIKFNMGIEKFIKDNKSFLPEEAEKMLELANKQKFSTDVHKANEIRAGLIKAFCEKERFISELPQATKDKVVLFKSLTEDEKARRSSEFFEIVENGVYIATQLKRAESKTKAFSNDDGYASKWKSAGAIFKKKEK